jgi:hypothetical protein
MPLYERILSVRRQQDLENVSGEALNKIKINRYDRVIFLKKIKIKNKKSTSKKKILKKKN